MPNTTDGTLKGKIEGDKIYSCKKKGDTLKLKGSFKGSKDQAAVIAAGAGLL
jgi:hypothetical protein